LEATGDISVWRGIAQDAVIMNLDDLLCVGATDNILLSSTIGRNKNLIPGEVIAAVINGTEEVLADLRSAGIGIYSPVAKLPMWATWCAPLLSTVPLPAA
jgi:phosphoribosylformylglycinamidine cyclo-ligase